jgi:predicted protein tyrosine phosphatase
MAEPIITCIHYAESKQQVIYFLNGGAHACCETCFPSMREAFFDANRAKVALGMDLECFSCGRAPSRMNKDLGMGFCDGCYRHQRVQDAAFQAGRAVPLDVVPDELIAGSLFIGPKEAAANPDTLRARNIKRVIVCCSSIPCYLSNSDEADIRYLRLAMADSLDQNLLEHLPYAFSFIEEGIRSGEATLVHCNAGVSRSGAVVVAWLMRSQRLSFAEALALAKTKRAIITPNTNFVEQLVDADLLA